MLIQELIKYSGKITLCCYERIYNLLSLSSTQMRVILTILIL